MEITVGTRGSKLALAQTQQIVGTLEEGNPGLTCRVVVIQTLGDKVQDRPLSEVGGAGIFVKELERALLLGQVDLAVHSLKDMPSALHPELRLGAFPRREDPRDVLVVGKGVGNRNGLPVRARIGTGSIRRRWTLGQLHPEWEAVPIRGNVDSRLARLEGPKALDGVVLAMAGLNRLGMGTGGERFFLPFSVEESVPSPCQGILGLQHRRGDHGMERLLTAADHGDTRLQALCERAFLESAGGSCHVPIGAYCRVEKDGLVLEGLLGDENLRKVVRRSGSVRWEQGNKEEQSRALGRDLGLELRQEVGL
ncbi:hydroxymethylbilane synthase [Anaerotalea alkaliphila]|uniref:Hydroxymethylbilane synthase n=1 Tax=Anaerotalea alkaliphila TaxID=2662126 RepID=A0A7X5HTQ1_9FIRM|nr:hydroxymethylbilane synthase [Anaerotalea alkaliphila]NDL66236.1 hydroxymethylbilane synthase [Anaerotalea alkaliphila]